MPEIWYNASMSNKLKELLERAELWSEEDVAELDEVAREIEARRTGVYRLSEDERQGIERGLASAQEGRFATDKEVDAIFRKARRVA